MHVGWALVPTRYARIRVGTSAHPTVTSTPPVVGLGATAVSRPRGSHDDQDGIYGVAATAGCAAFSNTSFL
jgi:hypothetical protein